MIQKTTKKSVGEKIPGYRLFKTYAAIPPLLQDRDLAASGRAGWFWSEVARTDELFGEVLDIINKVMEVFARKEAPTIAVGTTNDYIVFAVIPAAPAAGFELSNTHIFLLDRQRVQLAEKDRGEFKTDPNKDLEGKRAFGAKRGIRH
jgi:hypothetical protein